MLFVVKANLHFACSEGRRSIVGGNFIWRRFSLDMPHFQSFSADMTSGALGIGSKRGFAVVTGAAILSLVKRLHNEIIFFLGTECFHFKKAAVAFFTAYLFYIHMIFMPEDNGLDRLGIKNTSSVGKGHFRGHADLRHTERY